MLSLHLIASAYLLKLTTSLDDLLWLSPFLAIAPSRANKTTTSLVYFSACVVVTLAAFLLGSSLLHLLRLSNCPAGATYWTAERFLAIAAACVLAFFSVREYKEWRDARARTRRKQTDNQLVEDDLSLEMHDLDERVRTASGDFAIDTPSTSVSPAVSDLPTVLLTLSATGAEFHELESASSSDSAESCSSELSLEEKMADASTSLQRLLIVCITGTLDDMIVFSAFVAGQGQGKDGGGQHLTLATLLIGTTFAAGTIVAVAWVFSGIPWFRDTVKKLPMWALMAGIAVYVLVMGLI